MMYLLALICLIGPTEGNDPRDERIKAFLARNDIEAWEQHLWRNPSHTVQLNDIMMTYKKKYDLNIAVNYAAFEGKNRQVLLNQPVKRIQARDQNIPRGLALQFYLDNFQSDLTYVVEGGTIWIVPGKGHLTDESKSSELASTLKKTKPKYDDHLNKEASNRLHIPPTDLQGALYFFANEDRGAYKVFVRDRNLPVSVMSRHVKIPAFNDMTYDAILTNLLDQVNAKYIINSGSVVVVPK